jgi:hypothetical protein
MVMSILCPVGGELLHHVPIPQGFELADAVSDLSLVREGAVAPTGGARHLPQNAVFSAEATSDRQLCHWNPKAKDATLACNT